MKNVLNRFVRDESGATAIEYGLIAALIAVVLIVAVPLVAGGIQNAFNAIAAALNGAAAGMGGGGGGGGGGAAQ